MSTRDADFQIGKPATCHRPTASEYYAAVHGMIVGSRPLLLLPSGGGPSTRQVTCRNHVTEAGVRPRSTSLPNTARTAYPTPHVSELPQRVDTSCRSYAVNTFTCHLNISSTNQYSIIRRGRFQAQLRAHTEIARQTISKTIVLSPTCPRPTNIARSPTLNPHSQFRAYRGLANRFSPLIIHEARVGPARKSISDKQEVWIKR